MRRNIMLTKGGSDMADPPSTARAEKSADGLVVFVPKTGTRTEFGDIGNGPYAEIWPCRCEEDGAIEPCEPPGEFWTVFTMDEANGMLLMAPISDFPDLANAVAYVLGRNAAAPSIEICYPWASSAAEVTTSDEAAETFATFDAAGGRTKRFVGSPRHPLASAVSFAAAADARDANWRRHTLFHADGRRTEPQAETRPLAPDADFPDSTA
jgi:hypothetical protein